MIWWRRSKKSFAETTAGYEDAAGLVHSATDFTI
jgi:hypothetical protein